MWQLILKLQRQKPPKNDQGFSMVEVLVSILVTTAFIMGTLQAMVINAFFQVRAEREAQATFWIQEDMEKIKAVAELPPLNNTTETSSKLACILGKGVNGFNYGFGGLLRDKLNTADYSVTGSTQNVQIASERNLVNKPYRLVRIVEGLEATPATTDPAGMRIVDQAPHVLRITYKVGEPDNSTTDKLKADDGRGFKETLATFYTEVIPSGAFKCSS